MEKEYDRRISGCGQEDTRIPHIRASTSTGPTNNGRYENRYRCSACGKSFPFLSHLQRHLAVHSDERFFCCHICKISYKFSRSLSQHQVKFHSKRAKVRVGNSMGKRRKSLESAKLCQECGKFLKNSNTLLAHRKTVHGNVARYTCELCGHTFGQKGNYFKHLRKMHGKQITEKCKQCRQCFLTSSELEAHLWACHYANN
ncbi:hypothetical protein T265_11484 [Opisthorchis viverrini]|uniref:C2H2-type domain-containing protein n=1 Tax=Opisthorchis viverrini TaxID=6198 RepID=A0A074Z2U2_OPIVI|nr:hypothetical protein T265_11484 [Opisthorchis viverrini]KER19837.1 hypothetical protein T265_11484 [Opisthorchis viverrini]